VKKAIIIGASSGIGKELAVQLIDNGYKVGITGRRLELLENIKSENPDAYFIKKIDVTETETSVSKLEELAMELGGADLLVLSAGIGDINNELDFEIEKRTIDTNVIGWTCIIDWAFNYFEKNKSGHLAAITSIAGMRGSRQAPSYNATKSYQQNYLGGMRQKAGKIGHSIFVTDIRPGLVSTDMAKGEGLFWVMPVEKAARQIYKAITNKKEVVYITKRWRIIAGVLKVMPRFVYNKM
jgi:short-subunit dehydrogenase